MKKNSLEIQKKISIQRRSTQLNFEQLLLYKIKIFVFVFSGMLKEFGGILELTENWSQSVLSP